MLDYDPEFEYDEGLGIGCISDIDREGTVTWAWYQWEKRGKELRKAVGQLTKLEEEDILRNASSKSRKSGKGKQSNPKKRRK